MEFEVPLTGRLVRISTSLTCTLNARCPPARSQKKGRSTSCRSSKIEDSRLHIFILIRARGKLFLKQKKPWLSWVSPYLKPERRSQCSRCPLSEWSPWRQPDLLSLNLSFWVPLGLIFINLHPMGPSGNSNQPILVHGVHILLNCIIPPRGFIPPMACENVTGSS